MEVERVVKQNGELRELVEELRDKVRTGDEVRVMAGFDVERALARVWQRYRARRRRMWMGAAAAVAAVVVGCAWWLWGGMAGVGEKEGDGVRMAREEGMEWRRGGVVLEMASGAVFGLDTLAKMERGGVVYENGEGVLVARGEGMGKGEGDMGVEGMGKDAGEETRGEAEWNRVRVPYGGTYVLVLEDGTRVHLNSGTVLAFPPVFGKEIREVRLEGEAYFEVESEGGRPFVVRTGGVGVRVLGTEFNVKAYEDEGEVVTTLVKGSVVVCRRGGADCPLEAGEQACYDEERGEMTVKRVETEVYTAWTRGMFWFKDMTLGEIVRMVARWYDLEVFYVNPGVQEVVYSGKMPMYASVEDVLRKFELSGEVGFTLNGRTLTVFER